MKRKLSLLVALFLTVGLTACGSQEKKEATTSEAKEQKTEKRETATDAKKDKTEKKEVKKSEFGTLTIYKEQKALNIWETVGPFELRIPKAQVALMEGTNEKTKELFNGKEKGTIVTIYMLAENKADDTNSFFPNKATIITNDGEQKEAHPLLSQQIGGEFTGKEKKEGSVVFLLDGDPEKINHLKLVFKAPQNKDSVTIGEEKTIEFDM
ncbi:hypothetical protein CN679_11010 [Bacillus pseudomycoides]|uniref:hypothetical protein n=1 Tax=Bacillus pseudomycoides TaxID=64104 RepID=UPI000BF013DD|nr:hypothetical protein [Bacillus pseudomycoides]PEI92403.1 hypothetical protein CN679_11010 [Bacillus pseudomycoides]PHF26510.1 hypothetical protein COF72_28700 [Bacillus pseudomycoides]